MRRGEAKRGGKEDSFFPAPFFLSSGLPFFTVAITMSPTPAAGRRLSRAPMPLTEMMYRFRAPELSAQDMTAPLVGQETSVYDR
jgi:hypothetical protein